MGIFRRLTSSGEGSELFPFKVQITTTTANRAFRLPIFDYEGLTPNIVVDWGDGSSDVITSSSDIALNHTYVSIGSYVISISGFMPAFTVNNSVANRGLYTAIVQFGINGLRRLNFQGCNLLTSIPSSASLSAVGGYDGLDEMIDWTGFMSRTGLTSIPSDMFNFSPNAQIFSSAFSFTPITSVPSGLFNNVPLATDFTSTFFSCTSLTTVPLTLFDLCPNVVNFSQTFRQCAAITSGVLQFTNNLQVSTFQNVYFMSSTTNSISGTAPTIWLRTPTPFGTGAFRNCTGLTNFASIPSTFK
jgi:hypothetical protein